MSGVNPQYPAVANTDNTPVTPYSNTGIEKAEVQHFETEREYASSDPEKVGEGETGMMKDIDTGIDPVYLKKLIRKIDWRLIPVLSMMYAISLIDRTNLAIARAANNNHMDKEIGTGKGDAYSIVTLIFFIPVSDPPLMAIVHR